MDIKLEGRGIWFTLHLLALHATTNINKDAYIAMVTLLAENFGCEQCKPDFKMFVAKIKKYYYLDNGLFKWSVEFHNHVNTKLNKSLLSFDEALLKYKNLVCIDCDKPTVKILVPINDTPTTTNLNIKSFY